MPSAIAHAYLHGFASGPQARKGRALADFYAAAGRELERPDLNRPSFAELTLGGMLEALDEMHAVRSRARRDAGLDGELRWRLIASSMGAWAAALWAQAHPGRVERAIWLCPAFDLPARWRKMLGEDAIERWQREGRLDFPDGAGRITAVGYRLIEDAATRDPAPAPTHPVWIVHGTRDALVDIESSREYVARHADEGRTLELLEVDDEHVLGQSLTQIEALAARVLLEDL